ncbi:hypothetical protein QYF36_027142 [Acer negundo]|nr:hypothetical protein QYF36_027142 [Acer negundo]
MSMIEEGKVGETRNVAHIETETWQLASGNHVIVKHATSGYCSLICFTSGFASRLDKWKMMDGLKTSEESKNFEWKTTSNPTSGALLIHICFNLSVSHFSIIDLANK